MIKLKRTAKNEENSPRCSIYGIKEHHHGDRTRLLATEIQEGVRITW